MDLRIPEQIALRETCDSIERLQKEKKKDFHYLDLEYITKYKDSLTDPILQSQSIMDTNIQEEIEDKIFDEIKRQDNKERSFDWGER